MREYRVRICEGLGVKFPGNHSARAVFQASGHGGRIERTGWHARSESGQKEAIAVVCTAGRKDDPPRYGV